ncbi:MAG: hypothetical protein GX446_00835, partial [Chthonomonadales bacterium]|nr:hypothetical protein [Chthonomonadales bacterium]
AVINRGLPECEVLDDAARTIAVTLLRCTGQGVGLPEDQRDSQMIGPHVFELALFPHGGDWRGAGVWREAHAFNVPMRAVQTDMHDGPVADGHAFLSVGPASLVPSAVKRSDDGNSIVVRAYSLADVPVTAEIDVGWPGVWRRHRLRLDESATDESSLVLPFEIATFGLERPMP